MNLLSCYLSEIAITQATLNDNLNYLLFVTEKLKNIAILYRM